MNRCLVATGVALPGMPVGSPGMEGGIPERYAVVLFGPSVHLHGVRGNVTRYGEPDLNTPLKSGFSSIS